MEDYPTLANPLPKRTRGPWGSAVRGGMSRQSTGDVSGGEAIVDETGAVGIHLCALVKTHRTG